MPLKVCTVFDSKAALFLAPFYEQSVGTAVRSFETAVNTPDHQFNKYPSDYTLFELGEFDESAATFDLHDAPVNLGLAITYVKENY